MEPFICNGLGLHTVEKQSPVHNFRCQSFKGPLFFDLFHRLTTSYDLLPYTRCATSVVMHLKNVKNVTVAGYQTGVWVETLVPWWTSKWLVIKWTFWSPTFKGYPPVSSNLACWKIHHVYPFSSMIFPLPNEDSIVDVPANHVWLPDSDFHIHIIIMYHIL